MENIEDYINRALFLGGFNTKRNLAEYLEISPSAINQWVKEGNIPKRHLNKIQKAMEKNINDSGNYIKSIKSNEGYIVQDKHVEYNSQASHDDPRAKTLLDKFNTLSEIGKIEAENCINNVYLKELKEKR